MILFFSVQRGIGYDTGTPPSGADGDAELPHHLCPSAAGLLDKRSADMHYPTESPHSARGQEPLNLLFR